MGSIIFTIIRLEVILRFWSSQSFEGTKDKGGDSEAFQPQRLHQRKRIKMWEQANDNSF